MVDRLTTAKILDEEDGVYTVSAEVFGKGIEMRLRSQRFRFNSRLDRMVFYAIYRDKKRSCKDS